MMRGVAQVLEDPAALRLGLVLVHFVWQGAALALTALIVLGLLRRASAAARYIALLVAFAAMALAPAVTFLTLPENGAPQDAAAVVPLGQPGAATTASAPLEQQTPPAVAALAPPPPSPTKAAEPRWRLRMGAGWPWLEARLAWVAGLWVIGVTVLSLRLLGGWWRIVRGKRRGVELSGGRWRHMLMSLSQRLKVGRPVRLLESAAAQVPTVIGWLRPVILLPPSVLTGLTPEQLEALVAHELAHIRRYDYLVNLAQTVVETLLFYHPAVWWLSGRIRAEREHCCDDAAAAVCGDAVGYARALAELEQLRGAAVELAVAASGGPLVRRVRRLLGVAEPRRNPFSAWQSGAIAITALVVLTLVCGTATTPALAREVKEAWRSPFGRPQSVAVNPADGSCWALAGSSLMHLAADGSVLKQIDGFWLAAGVVPYLSVNPRDGSCWVPDISHNQVVHLAKDGTELWRGGEFKQPKSVSPNPEDGSCWVADYGNNEVVHLAADGRELWRGEGFKSPTCVSVNPTDGSCWVGDYGNDQVVHLAADGAELWRGEGFKGPESVSVNPTDGSCWVADLDGDQVAHLSADGTELWRGTGFVRAWSVSVNARDGSCWVACGGKQEQDASGGWRDVGHAVVHLAEDGSELWRGESFLQPLSVSMNPADGTCWVADNLNGEVVHLAANGVQLGRYGSEFRHVGELAVNPGDGSCWVPVAGRLDRDSGEYAGSAVVRLGRGGRELWRGGDLKRAGPIAVNAADGSFWVGDLRDHRASPQVVHCAADGRELWRGGDFKRVTCLSVDPRDGSCWIADGEAKQAVRLGVDGVELWRGGKFELPVSISANPADGSCWVADMGRWDSEAFRFADSAVVHLAADGTELWRGGGFERLRSVSVNPKDGSCWVAQEGKAIPDTCGDLVGCAVMHLAADGTELWRGEQFARPHSVSVNPKDGSCWVADTWNNQVVHLGADGGELWRGGGFNGPLCVSVDPTDGSCWVADYQNHQVVRLAAGGGRAEST
jgi:beta-lactamase regulating signal transducer with metallopeptidase domain/DNA-binding beta-propeller fold protein YncE